MAHVTHTHQANRETPPDAFLPRAHPALTGGQQTTTRASQADRLPVWRRIFAHPPTHG